MSEALLSAMGATGARLQPVAAAKGWDRMVERDFQRALESVTGARPARLTLAHWPAVGPVDLMLPGAVAVELKWCRSGDTLGNCAWDVAKLGCAIAEAQVEHGFLAAGAPEGHWAGADSGVDLFTSRVYENDALARRFEGWWRFWCRDVATRPVDLPMSIAVVEAGSVPVELGDVAFVLRLARVEVVDASWRVHVCPHRWRDERCPPRSWDPDGWGGLPRCRTSAHRS